MRTTALFSILTTCFIALSMTLYSCKGKDGAPGPTGPAGTNGIDGKDGTNGINGTNGNANVIGTNTITTFSSDWTGSGIFYSTKFNVPGITQSIVDKGTVLVFIKYGTEWLLLPDISGKNIMQYTFGVGYVSILNYNTDYSTNSNPGTKTFRVVIIAASN
jgi:hypothetical protein